MNFTVNGKLIDRVHNFRYLGRILSDDDDDTPCIRDNLKRARWRWNSLARILKREGANAICMSRFYLTVVQAVLLYGADSWVVKDSDRKKLQSFHRRALRYMTGHHIRKRGEKWEHPNHELLAKQCRLFDIDTYIARRRGTLREYMDEFRKDLLDHATTTRRHNGDVNKLFWWDQKWIPKKEMQDLKKL